MRQALTSVLACVLVLAVAGRAHAQAVEVPICDFEDETSLEVWKPGPTFSFTRERATEGRRAAKVTFSTPLSAGGAFPKDWSPYKAITWDVYNPGQAVSFSVRIADAAGKAYTVDERVVPPGLSGFTLDLIDVSVNIDLTKVAEFTIAPKEGAPELVLDQMRFLAIRLRESDVASAESLAPRKQRVVMDFEEPLDVTYFEVKSGSVELSEEHATSGKRSLKVAPATYLVGWKFPALWTGYDVLEADFFNDTGAPVPLSVLVGDKPWVDSLPRGTAYWNRYNADQMIPPGCWTFSLSVTGMYRGHVGSRFNDLKTPIDPGSIIRVDFGIGQAREGATGSVYLDHIRLVKAHVPEGILAFDFGPESQVLQPGFSAVSWNTVYDEDAGYGLKRGLAGPSRARDDTFPSKLYRDYAQFDEGAEFLVDLPGGRYHVFVVFDDVGYWGWEAARHTKRRIEVEGQVVWSEDLGERGGWWRVNHLFEEIGPVPGNDFWELYMTKMFEPKEFDVEVTDGRLNLTVIADAAWSAKVAGVIIYADEMKAVGDKFLAETVQAQRDEFTAAAAEVPTPAGGSLDALPQAEKAKGWLFFLTDYEQDTFFATVPEPGQPARETSIFASLGECEPVTFAVRPLRDLGKARVTVSDFAGPDGATIPSSAWDVRVVRHLSRRGFSGISYLIIPQMLRPFEAVDLPADLTREFWATVHIPEGATPGEYSGTIRVASEGGLDETLGVRLTVLPFTLDGSDYVFGFFGNPPDEQVARLLLEHGMNSFSGGPRIGLSGWDDEGAPVLDFSPVDAMMEMVKRAGFSQELCGYGGPSVAHVGYTRDEAFFGDWEKKTGRNYVELLATVFDAVKAHAEEAEWLPFTYNLADETRNPDVAARQVEQMRAIEQAAPWLKTTAQYSVTYRNGSDPEDYHQRIFEALKTSGLNSHDESVMQKARELGKEIYIYNQGQSRYSFGAYQWSEHVKGVKGRFQWHIHVQHGFQYFDLDGREPDTGVLYYGEDGPIPTLALERCREGADDFYYCQTLFNLASKADTPVAREALAMLKTVTDRIGLDERQQPEWLDNDRLRTECAAYVLRMLGRPVPECLTSGAGYPTIFTE